MNQEKHINRLIDSSSPYLRQHAHNPVDWYPWGEEALEIARKENKPIILSIGYSSCHWCHVMAHESFEDESVAAYMNAHFVNIKLDREERPDIDNIYMDAVQAMGLRGGWPLNVFLTPDQKPFYGGTYFPKQQWHGLLQNITEAYQNNYDKLLESAEQFTAHLQKTEANKYNLSERISTVSIEDLQHAIDKLSEGFDSKWGGMNKAPKFPMPSVWNYLMQFSHQRDDDKLQEHLLFTLDKIMQGGIYDQIGGGFARYSVDGEWHVPHFEKMLYDNGQLMSLYANTYKINQNPEYAAILIETAQWLKREMTNKDGGFYSALDADSEGVEGKFYVWSYDEVKELNEENFNIISKYYDVSKDGNWEETNVLRRLDNDSTFAQNWKITESELERIISQFKITALKKRSERIRPGLDDKIISGWNGLILTGLCDAYQATQKKIFLDLANENATFIRKHLISDSKLLRTSDLKIEGFMEDYAAVIQAFIKYYETTFDPDILLQADQLSDHVLQSFFDKDEKLFYYTSTESENLIARKKELFDNVIPSSNAIMAENLYKLGLMLYRDDFRNTAQAMVAQVSSLVKQEAEYMSYWSSVTLLVNSPTAEIIIVGNTTSPEISKLQQLYLPNKIMMAGKASTELPPFESKSMINDQTTFYVCYNKSCKLPVVTLDEALSQVQ